MNPENLVQAVRDRNAARIRELLFDGDPPRVTSGARTETEFWDYKTDIPNCPKGWARVARHVLAFHNHRGGALIFGITDADLRFVGASTRFDSKTFNDKIRRYVGDRIWVDFHREAIQSDQRYLGIAIVPPRGAMIGYFQDDAPTFESKCEFHKGDSALRVGDSSKIMDRSTAIAHQASLGSRLVGSPYAVDTEFFRILALETPRFIQRPELSKQIENALVESRTSVTSLIGIGGSGKTTLATWAALQAHERGIFHYIVSITAKDRELTTDGIKSLSASSTTYENLLDGIADVLGFPEYVGRDINEQEVEIRSLLENSNGLLYVDNLETVDDPRVIQFLDDLPVGVKALITSRRQAVRVAVRPIDVGPLTEDEARLLVRSLEPEPGFGYIAQLHDPEIDQITESCDRLPLAIRWTLARAGSATEAMYRADALPESKGKSDGQLLEFVFRRVFDAMSDCERAVMQILSIFQDPSSAEAVVTGAGHPGHLVMDALDDLTRDALSQRLYDEDRNDYVYALAPLTRSFVLGELQRRPEVEKRIRKRLSEWYEAKDIKNLDERLIIREIRQGRGSSDDALVDLAQAAQKRGDLRTAQEMYENALKRNPNSWRAARLCAEFERHVNRDTTRALQLYEQAAANAPRHGHDRALIHRELGMLLRDSGRVDATDAAIEKFEIARQETPNDAALNHALAVMYTRKGMYMKVITLLEPLRSHPSPKTREMALHELVKAYEKTTNILEAAEAKQELAELRTKGQPR